MDFILQSLVLGIQKGAIYALIAVGYTMVYGVLKMINFAHGDVYMLGAFFAFYAITRWFVLPDHPTVMALVGVLLLTAFLCAICGFLIERFAYRPLRHAPRLTALITAIGVSFLLENGGLVVFGTQQQFITIHNFDKSFHLGSIAVNTGQLALLIVSISLMVILQFIVQKTAFGRAMRAISQDTQAAALMGINTDRVIAITFMLGAAMAGIGGAMNATFLGTNITPYFGLLPGVKAFVAAVLGGIGNIPGAMLGGLLMGIAEAVVGGSKYSSYSEAVAFVVLLLVLLVRPAGLLGKSTMEKV